MFHRLLFFLLCFTGMVEARDLAYYRTHPQALEEAIQTCLDGGSSTLLCSSLQPLAVHMDRLARECRYSPQAFGKTILALQMAIAEKTHEHQQGHRSQILAHTLQDHQEELAERLAVVKWLESPEHA